MEIAVVTRAPRTVGNMAMTLDTYIETDEEDEKFAPLKKVKRLVPPDVPIEWVLSLRAPVFQVGEILLLDENGRELTGAGRKPSKWDVDVVTASSLEEAVAISQKALADAEPE